MNQKNHRIMENTPPDVILITGAMFSGKSKKLIDIIDSYEAQNKKVLKFKPKRDKRDLGVIRSRDYEKEHWAYLIGDGYAPVFKKGFFDTIDLIVVDEAQFLDIRAVRYLIGLGQGYNVPVILSGLNKDFRGNTFVPIALLRKYSTHEIKLNAKCFCCNHYTATQTRRVIDNVITLKGKQILCGDSESYISVCPACDKKLLEGMEV